MNPIIVALDVDSAAEARRIVDAVGGATDFFKVGMELYAAAGMEFVRELKAEGRRVFLDMKFYDISETVKRAVAQVAKAGVDLLTVHGSMDVMKAAVAGRGSAPLKLLGVTVLTSFDETDLADLGYPCNVQDLVALRARNAKAAGMDGIVCAAVDLTQVRAIIGSEMLTVVPGVRSVGAAAADQKRVATPADAMRDGATYLVIGRQVTRAADPRTEVDNILAEIERAIMKA
ncbi:MAG TPA: orotidine-5'-phosphate decarboxylase [Bryobacteraceae bacterium]|jgi:orotidine-5'-phosphate decarboxylase